MTVAALDLLGSVVLEDGERWADRAADFQWECARSLLDPSERPFRWESRPRGGSKTTDLAGILLAAMLTQLPSGARCDAYAGGRDQARLLVDALDGLVQRTPGLASVVEVSDYKATTRSGVILEVMSADAATAHGRRPAFAVADELCQWPSASNARRLWEVVFSSMAKVPGARLAVITTSGDPSHWSRKVFAAASKSPLWSVGEVPGPLQWIDRVQLEEQRRMLPDSAFARYHLNQWTAAEDRLVRPDDLAACVVLSGPQDPREGHSYVVGLDVGLKNDRTVAAVCHSEPLEDGREGRRAVLDRLEVWQGSRFRPVELGAVEAWLLEASRRYNRASIVADPWQAVGLLQRLRDARVRVEEFTFGAQSVGRLASGLLVALRDRRLALPDDEGLLDELGSVRLRETSPGVLRMDHDSDRHDDRAVALALAVNWLGEHGGRRARGRVVYPPAEVVSGGPGGPLPPGALPVQPSPGRFVTLGERGLQELFPGGRRGR